MKGQIFNRLKVLEFSHIKNKKYYWKCLCECGKECIYRSDLIKIGRRKSCGCINSPDEKEYLKKLEKRLLAQSKRKGGCLEWTGKFNPFGYGIFKLRSSAMKGLTSKKTKNACFSCGVHRVAYKVWIGEIPKGMHVLHRCDFKACIEPTHLFLGTHQDNMDDMKKKNRQNKRPGEKHHMCILHDEDIIEIRRLWDEGLETQTGLGRKFGISSIHAHNIVRRKTWKHIP